jgi:oxysterol-binding protein-related protein 8
MPNMYARGILFGKMVLELGDTCTARNDKLGLYADLEFKTKVGPRAASPRLPTAGANDDHPRTQGYFSGTYNAIGGKVRHGASEIGTISGKWSHVMEFKPSKVRVPLPPILVPRILDLERSPRR